MTTPETYEQSVARTGVTWMWSHQPPMYIIRAEEAAEWIMAGTAIQQSALLFQMAAKVRGWEPGESWPQQCRHIAELMTEEQCDSVRNWLSTLIEHLEAIPRERAAKQVTNTICQMVEAAVSP